MPKPAMHPAKVKMEKKRDGEKWILARNINLKNGVLFAPYLFAAGGENQKSFHFSYPPRRKKK